jgi:hypothetical protein
MLGLVVLSFLTLLERRLRPGLSYAVGMVTNGSESKLQEVSMHQVPRFVWESSVETDAAGKVEGGDKWNHKQARLPFRRHK